ncbi:TPA: hypothetical protein HA235_03540 [Candidatus Woesearchaeota archaeon]|nr:cupredoxin domain-containing protein [Candidatus Woesearchaeota archaeon]HIH31754.1 hypothetical protein [Candidatus Woesearchaeota archaeon]HIH54685.1 hypothetical protein [Candidatus Woesearchaeota archaeon]HIJ02583.1 hypothetical protein [Candidatus Woesearchaeota archaeon]HIJ13975.1 hypothetical protein [Candidatus Woesearchaeota archaeon]
MKIYGIIAMILVLGLLVGCTQQVKPTGNTVSTNNQGGQDYISSNNGNTVGNTNTQTTQPNTTTNTQTNNIKTINIVGYNFGFDVTGPQINKGDNVKIIFSVTSGTHGLAIPGLNVDTAPISPGQEKVLEFTADKSGTYDFYCNTYCGSGHREMTGTLVIN